MSATATHTGPDGTPLVIDFTGRLDVWAERRDLWTFFRVPDPYTARLDAILTNQPRGFRSVPVVARLDDQEWSTALFRYKDGSWSLPVKATIRRRHHLDVGDEAKLHLRTEGT